MRRSLIIFIFLLISILNTTFCQRYENDLTNDKIKGRVKYMEKKEWISNEKNCLFTENEMTGHYIYKFDEKGNLVSLINMIKNYSFQYLYKYDLKNIIQQVLIKDGIPLDTFLLKYDSYGNLIEINGYMEDGTVHKSSFKYDIKGNMIENREYKIDGSQFTKAIFIYDSLGNNIEKNTYLTDGEWLNKFTYKYDLLGNKIESISGYRDGNPIYKETCKYNDKNYIIEVVNYKKDWVVSWNEHNYEYDKQGNWIKEWIFDKKKSTLDRTDRKFIYYGDKDQNDYPQWDK